MAEADFLSELTTQPAATLLRSLRESAFTAEYLVTQYLDEIERLNGDLRAFVHVDSEGTLKAARSADAARRQGLDLPLLGLPISIKSSIEVAGLRCETGSLLHQGHIPNSDAEAVRRLKAAGAIVLGTTNCPEFLMAYETDNLLYGRTANPWKPAYTAGGSSGGEAAAIAAGLSAGGLGSDSGGSVREPAHFCGICALKPTSGRISAAGHTLPCIGPFSLLGSLGPMARTIADIELLFSVLADQRPSACADAAALRSRPIAVLEDDGLAPVSPETRQAVRAAADALRGEGFNVVPFRSDLLEPARKLWWTFFMRCGRLLLEPVVAAWHGELSPTFRYYLETVRAEPLLTASELLTAWGEADELRPQLERELAAYTAVLTPVASIPAFRHGERTWHLDGRPLEYFEAMRFTQWFNLLGAPAAVVPVSASATGLPLGVQIASVPHRDEEVLAIAALLERNFGYRPPPIALGGRK